MRITIFHSHITAVGGAEILLATQARWLAAAGHEVQVVALKVDAAQCARYLDGLHVREVGVPTSARDLESLPARVIPDLVTRVRPFLRDADVVMAYNFPAAPLAAAAADSAGRRVWYACEPCRALYLREGNPEAARRVDRVGNTARDFATRQVARRLQRRGLLNRLLPWTERRHADLRHFDGQGVRSLDAVASLSQFSADCVRNATGRTDTQIVSPMVRFTDSPSRPSGIRRRGLQILAQSRIGIPKNFDTLIRGFAQFRRVHPDAVLHIVGTGSRRSAVERVAREHAAGHVRFHGYLTAAALDALAAECDVFAFAPVDEPFGMVFPEAAARGLLLVGSDHGGPREILEDGAIGELCDPFDPASISAALERTVALTDAQADARRHAANASVRARFGAQEAGRQLEAFLRG